MNTDVCIIGAGPVGIFSIFQAGMLGMNCHVVDILSFPGGQCSALYPEKPIYDIPAYPSIAGGDLIEKLMEQASIFKPVFHLNSRAISIDGDKNSGFSVKISSKSGEEKVIFAKSVIIAGGCGSFDANKPPLSGIEQYENNQVLYFIDKISKFKDQRVVIAGGGDSAVDWAINLADIARSVYLVHRRANFRCMPESEKQLERLSSLGKVKIMAPFQLKSLAGQGGMMTGVEIQNIDTNEDLLIEADFLLPFFGLKTELGVIENWGLEISKRTIQVKHGSMETSRPGIYAIGDICGYEGKLKLILCGFSESAMAIHHLYSIVFPDRPLHFEHSTSKKF